MPSAGEAVAVPDRRRIQCEPPHAASAVKVLPATKVSSQQKWEPMLGRNPELKEKVGRMPPL